MSKNTRYAIYFAFYGGGFILLLVLPVRLSLYAVWLVALIYFFGVQEAFSRVLGGVSSERTVSFPFPIDRIFNAVPRVFKKNRWGFHGKIVETDSASGRYIVKLGWRPWLTTMTINLSNLDENTTKVNVLSETNYFFDLGASHRLIDTFLNKLYASLTTGRQPLSS